MVHGGLSCRHKNNNICIEIKYALGILLSWKKVGYKIYNLIFILIFTEPYTYLCVYACIHKFFLKVISGFSGK